MTCSRCGSRYPNPGCYVCYEPETHPETPDRDGGSLLKTYEDNRHCIHLLRHPRGLGCRVLPLTCPPQRELMKPEELVVLKYILLIGGGAIIGWNYRGPWWGIALLTLPLVFAIRIIINLLAA